MAANPIMGAIGTIDLVAAFFLVWAFPGTFMLIVGIALLGKGVWSIISSLHAGFYMDMFGVLDFVAALVLLIVNSGFTIEFAWLIGVILALKAGYTMLSSI